MRRIIGAMLIAATALGGVASPALAQSRPDQIRWEQAQARYEAETQRFEAERDRFYALRRDWRPSGYDAPPPPPPPGAYADDRYEDGYDASRYYRGGGTYSERVLGPDDRVYAGSDGRYYCKRNDGTTGLIVGAASGGILGNVIDGGHSRAAGTLIGAAVGALAGKAIDQSSKQVRCR